MMVVSNVPSEKWTENEEEQAVLIRASATASWTRLEEIRDRLRLEKRRTGHLKPGDTVNRIFTELVDLCVHTASTVEESLLMSHGGAEFDRMAAELREYASEGEAHLEKFWAQKMIADNREGYAKRGRLFGGLVRNPLYKPKYPLQKFIYYQNYVDLARLELAALHSVMPQTAGVGPGLRLVFIGSGPMPLSSVEIGVQAAGNIDEIHNIDSDPEAIRMSSELSKIFSFEANTDGGRTRYTFECADIRDVSDLRRFDVVYMASLVGANDSEKIRILRHLKRITRVGAHLVVRTVHGLRRLLYPRVSMTQLRLAGFEELLEVHPFGGDGVVNSVLIVRSPAKDPVIDDHLSGRRNSTSQKTPAAVRTTQKTDRPC